jgi:predicted ribosomally synthesized peptide with nif11-like leader
MSVKEIRAFSDKARNEAELGKKLKSCQKVRDMLALSKEYGFGFIEDELIALKDALADYKPKAEKVTWADAPGMTIEVKREGRGAV